LADVPTYREHPAHEALRPFVSCTWSDSSGPVGGSVLPDGCIDIVWGDGVLFIAGPDTGPVPTPGRTTFTGVRFRPGCAPAFLGVPASDLRDRRVSLADVWGREGAELEEMLGDAAATPGAPSVARRLEDALLRRLPAVTPVDPVVAATARALRDGSSPVATLARRLDVGERQLHRRCVNALGYGPKTLDRILRFQRALDLGWAGMPLARISADAGYADQAHFTREFRRLAGATPSDLFKTATTASS
jgi:AraC-like DNA-binding protein